MLTQYRHEEEKRNEERNNIMNTFAITGATGHIGYRTAELLLERGCKVRVVARPEKLEPLVKKGAEAAVGSLADSEFLTRAFHGAEAVFAMIPPDYQAENVRNAQTRIGACIADSVRAAGVKHVVNLSSQGAELPLGTGPIAGLHEQEERLDQLPGVNVVHLRAAFFMENLESSIGLIKTQGIIGTPLKGDLKLPVIATRDIARVAADSLVGPGFTGRVVRDLLGQRDLSMVEMTGILATAIGKPELRYVQFPYESAKLAMLGMGLSPDVARVFIEMYQALNERWIMSDLVRTPANTTETSFEAYASEFALLYAGAPSETPAARGEPKEEERTTRRWRSGRNGAEPRRKAA